MLWPAGAPLTLSSRRLLAPEPATDGDLERLQEIHAKIMSLQLDDCKVYISNVDSQGSAEHGIIVQVIGEMSNANGPWRKFAQTFFLAEQPNGYFVLNDICRYIKEEGDGDEPVHLSGADAPAVQSDDQPTNAAHVNDTDGEPASVQSVLFNEASTPPPPATAAAQPDQASSSTEQEQPTPQSGSTDSFTFHANGIAADAADESQASPAAGADASKEEPTPAEAEPEVPAPPSSVEEPSKPEASQEQEAPAAAEEPQPITAVEEKEGSAPEPAAAPAPASAKAAEPKKDEVKKDEPAPPPAPVSAPTPKSWASLAASNTTKKWAGVATSERKGTSAAPVRLSLSLALVPGDAARAADR